MVEYWFKPKRYGYGATPITWQGWLISALTAIAMVAVAVLLPLVRPAGPGNWIAVIVIDLLIIVPLVLAIRRKTDGDWRWRWGGGNGR